MTLVLGTSHSHQVSFVGPFGVGKTTAVTTVSDTKVSSTDVLSSALRLGGGRHLKSTTTVGLEVGEWRAADGANISVVGTPGQERFDLVRRTAMPRSTAVVLWLYGQHRWALLDAELWLEFITAEVPTSKMTLAVTRLDEPGGEDLARFRTVVDQVDPSIPVLAADPRDRASVEEVICVALARQPRLEVAR